MLIIEIRLKKGIWTINEKPFKDCDYIEQKFFNEFIANIKTEK